MIRGESMIYFDFYLVTAEYCKYSRKINKETMRKIRDRYVFLSFIIRPKSHVFTDGRRLDLHIGTGDTE